MGAEVGADEVESGMADEGAGVDEDEFADGESDERPVGRPWAASALTTASQPFSSVLIRSLSSWFSRSRASSAGDLATAVRPIPALSCLFSSSSS